MRNTINIKHISNLNNDCLRGLAFYKQELAILQERLEEIAGKNTGKEVSIEVEHFQNQFLIHDKAIDDLQDRIHVNDKELERELTTTIEYVRQDTAAQHQKVHEDYQTEEKLFNELRHEFNRFAAKWM
ncbi:MAG: hypothetical protein ACXVJD_14850 [Mucilaginibacter sp.]